ncbi:MAG: hypothetical protein CMC96_12925 [Flavobacteriales bacterium]|nr:hypothetical protein [Flavobacteriales bacterium]|tara:strand:- start:25829 stop:26851 length:1023 start_codon:yes stop_codon:yes gene_type:complete
MKFNKLLLVGSTYSHTINYYHLIKEEFQDVQLFADQESNLLQTKVFDFSLKNIFSIPKRIKKLRLAIQNYNPDIIHVHQANAFAFFTIIAAKKLKIPIVTTLWGSDVLIMPKRNFLLRKMFQFIIENSDALTADAKILAVEAKKYTNKNVRIEIANYGIDFLEFDLKKENTVYSNRLHKPLYRIDKIINDFVEWEKSSSWKLLVGAVGTETENLKQIARTHDKKSIEFCGWLEKKENLANYARSKLYVSIPESDGTAISLLEAMYYECFPIVSDLAANREWVKDEINGIIVKEGEGVFDRLNNVDIDTAIALNKKLIEEKGSKEVNKSIFLKIYNSLVVK